MKQKLLLASLGLLGLIASQNASAVPPSCSTTYSSASRTDNRVYAGLSWELNGSNGLIPDLVLGARSLNVNSSNSVNGADLNMRIRYKNDISFDSVRLAYVGGSRNILGNAGLGYSLTNNDVFATAAAQSAYSRLGGDYQFSKESINPYLEGNSLYSPKAVPQNATVGICPS